MTIPRLPHIDLQHIAKVQAYLGYIKLQHLWNLA